MTLTGDQVYGRIDLTKLEPLDHEFLSTVRAFENDRVYFKRSYLEQKLGELPSECYDNEDFYHYVCFNLTARMVYSSLKRQTLFLQEECSVKLPL